MDKKTNFRPYIIRLAIVFLICLIFVALFNEVTFILQKDENDRAPKTLQLVIPAGTADQVNAGQDVLSIPSDLVFVLGDTLEVKNEDYVSHQLGPVWVPPGSSASIVMENAAKYAYSCSFQTSQYLGIDVRQPITYITRLTAMGLAAPTMTALVFIYSLIVIPVKKNEDQKQSAIPSKADSTL